MESADQIRNNIINKLLTISNIEYLSALHIMLENSQVDNDLVKLTKEQKLMLEMSQADIKAGRVISQNDLDKADLKWLKEL